MMYELAIVGVALADRFLLKRNAVTIVHTHQVDDKETVRFALAFRTKQAISRGFVTYSLRNKKRPTAVVAKTRKLDFSSYGSNQEFLTFNKKTLEREAGESISGEWILDVKIERSCSRLNPLYKIFPTVTTHQQEFEILDEGHLKMPERRNKKAARSHYAFETPSTNKKSDHAIHDFEMTEAHHGGCDID